MSENIYAAPKSDLDTNKNFRGKPAKAIIFGLLISIVGSLIGAVFIGIGFGIYWSSIGMSSDQIQSLSQTDTPILIMYLIESGIFSIWSGFYVAKKTNYQEYKHCAIMVLISTLIGVVLLFALPTMYEHQPFWYTAVSFLVYPLAVLCGCWLYMKSKIITY